PGEAAGGRRPADRLRIRPSLLAGDRPLPHGASVAPRNRRRTTRGLLAPGSRTDLRGGRGPRRGGTDVSLLAVDGLTVQYGGGRTAVTAVSGVGLTVERGRVLGLVGESGS